jgi:hypothetical protein
VKDELEKNLEGSGRGLMLNVLPRYSREGTKENHGNLSQYSRSPGRDLNPELPEYKVRVLTTGRQDSLINVERSDKRN